MPLYSHRMANVHLGLVIGSCLGLPLFDALHRTARETQLALVAPNRAAICGGFPAPGAGLTAAGSLEEILLPNGWAQGILVHCILDELPHPRAAFTELARTAGPGVVICLPRPASAGPSPTRVAGVRATVWPVHGLLNDLCDSGFTLLATSDLTAQVVARRPQERRVAFGSSANVCWIVLEAQRRPRHGS